MPKHVEGKTGAFLHFFSSCVPGSPQRAALFRGLSLCADPVFLGTGERFVRLRPVNAALLLFSANASARHGYSGFGSLLSFCFSIFCGLFGGMHLMLFSDAVGVGSGLLLVDEMLLYRVCR